MIKTNSNHNGWCIYNLLKLSKFNTSLSLFLFIIGIFLLPKTAYLSAISPDKIIELTNKIRVEENVGTLNKNILLEEAAIKKAETILIEQTFEHNINGRRFSAWVRDVRYDYSYVGENLAIDFITSEGVIKAWLESEGHKKNLLHPEYREIGVGIVEGMFNGAQTIVVAQIFGTPSKTAIPAEVLARNEQINSPIAKVLGERERIPKVAATTISNITPSKGITPYSAVNAAIISLPLAIIIFYLYMFSLSCFVKEEIKVKYNQ